MESNHQDSNVGGASAVEGRSGVEYQSIPQRVLAVYAHPDDAEISAGATLARWSAAGSQVWVLVCTRGEKGSSDPQVDCDELADRRAGEMQVAGEILGLAGRLFLDYGDGELEDTAALRGAIVRHIRTLRPDVIVAPDPTAILFGGSYVNHRDHRVLGISVLDATAPSAGNPHYFAEQIAQGLAAHVPGEILLSGTLEPNCWVDVAESIERKIEAVACHASQLVETGEAFREFVRERAADEGRMIGSAYAEGFRRIVLAS